jgi:thymidylate synthase (FAD)
MNEFEPTRGFYLKTPVLDHGYIQLVTAWGDEEGIIEAARMSTGKGFVSWDPYEGHPKGDAGLLRFLYENSHSTPFEMAGAIIEVQAPIFVFREWHRHRTQSYNEMSARYAPLPDVNYVPSVERLLIYSKTNKQAGVIAGAAELTFEKAQEFRNRLERQYDEAEQSYQIALTAGVPKELARIHLPVGRYSRMRASANLRNWIAFLTLREAAGAQWEIRQYANALHEILKVKFPRTIALFEEKIAVPQSLGRTSK